VDEGVGGAIGCEDAVDGVDRILHGDLGGDELTGLFVEVEHLAGPDTEPVTEGLGNGHLPFLGDHASHTSMIGIHTDRVNIAVASHGRRRRRGTASPRLAAGAPFRHAVTQRARWPWGWERPPKARAARRL